MLLQAERQSRTSTYQAFITLDESTAANVEPLLWAAGQLISRERNERRISQQREEPRQPSRRFDRHLPSLVANNGRSSESYAEFVQFSGFWINVAAVR
jgi:hypothetical protein